MLALVDGVPRTLTIDQFISNWVDPPDRRHPAAHPLPPAPRPSGSAHVYRGLVKALDMLDEVIALIRRSPDVDEARDGLIALLDIDEVQASAILDMQLRRLAALERQKIIDELAELELVIADLEDILANEAAAARRSSARSSARSSTSTATTGVPRSSRPTATSRWRT